MYKGLEVQPRTPIMSFHIIEIPSPSRATYQITGMAMGTDTHSLLLERHRIRAPLALFFICGANREKQTIQFKAAENPLKPSPLGLRKLKIHSTGATGRILRCNWRVVASSSLLEDRKSIPRIILNKKPHQSVKLAKRHRPLQRRILQQALLPFFLIRTEQRQRACLWQGSRQLRERGDAQGIEEG